MCWLKVVIIEICNHASECGRDTHKPKEVVIGETVQDHEN